ncbi:MAG: transcriptional regulator [archaeon]|nr:transcriptional regulator [archaeon]
MKNNEFRDIKYILTSTMRTKLLISLKECGKNLEALRNDIPKPSATILHGLKELENMHYVKKVNKTYHLTSNGELLTINLLKLIENWYTINKNEIFWNNHCLNDIPIESMRNIFLLKDAKCVISTNTDLTKALTTYMEMISKSTNLKIILPIFSETHLNIITDLIEKEDLEKIEILTTETILKSIETNVLFKKRLESDKINVKILKKDVNVFLTCCDDYITMNLFFKGGHFDDSQLLISKVKME